MRMLGEMATANPSTGSFSDYARSALGGWAGFSAAWLYWYFWVIVVGFEAVAGARSSCSTGVDAPLWLVSLVLMVLMTVTNLASVRFLRRVRVLVRGHQGAGDHRLPGPGHAVCGRALAGQGVRLSNLMTSHGGFLPKGVSAIFSSIVVVVFSMVGAEIATIAAAESKDPEKAVAQATNSVILRVATFFVGSIFLLALILPWNTTGRAPRRTSPRSRRWASRTPTTS